MIQNLTQMKKIILVCCLIFSIVISAQIPSSSNKKTGEISGKIIDSSSNEALPYVSIVIKDSAHKTITGGITNDNGTFIVKQIPEGENIVEIQFIGYKTEIKTISITRSNSTINLGTIALKEEASKLDEVTVIAETSTVTQKIDRKVINVGKDLTSAGATASELLNNVQSVSVDSQTGNISLRGNENVRVLVDGKPTNINAADLLKQLPSTSIKSVELITNPSAKYNPEGMSGIINIVLHKNSNLGFNASLNSGLTVGENNRFNGSIDMNLKTGKINFFANLGVNDGKNENYGKVIRNDNNNVQDFFFIDDANSYLLKIGADVYLNAKNTFSVYTIQNKADNIFKGNTLVSTSNIVDANSKMLVDNKATTETYNFNYSLDFDKKGHNLEFEANFSSTDRPEIAYYNETLNPSNLFLNYNDDVKNLRKNTLLNIDYTNPLSKNSKLELGAEYRVNDTENNRVTTQLNIDNSSFTYDRNIYSAYVNFNQKINKLSMQLGARFEQYEIEGEFTKGMESANYFDEIFSVYPSAFFTYTPSEKNQYQLSYSRRVDRPGIGQVNPIREWSTPQITSVGNPNLRPQFTNSFELNYTRQYNKGSLTFGTFYRRVNDNITRILNKDEFDENNVEISYTNASSNNRYGFEISSNHKFTNWWRMNASFDLYTQKESGIANGQQIEITNEAVNFRINNNFKATKNLRFQLFALYRGGGQSIQFNVDPMWMINTGASLNILKGKGTLNFRVNDIFKGMKFKFESENPYPFNGQFNWESQTAYLGFIYRFGGGKNKAKRRKSRDNNEAQGSGGFM
jgi:outer membrane receptor protein involved in Fe transport